MANQERRCHGSLYDFAPMAATYERWYSTPAGRVHDREQKALVRRFLPPIEQGHRLLDVGCGTGHWSRFFASLGLLVVGIDISSEMIAAAQSATPRGCRFLVADAHELPFADGCFDIVAAMVTLEFVADAEKVLAEMSRCTRPAGHLLVGALNRTSPLNRRRIADRKAPYYSARMFSAPELRELLSRFGRPRLSVTSEVDRRTNQEVLSASGKQPETSPAIPSGAFIVAEMRL
jgi:ubiquinone/menaquinone biosynthesis C-methylase UbiE